MPFQFPRARLPTSARHDRRPCPGARWRGDADRAARRDEHADGYADVSSQGEAPAQAAIEDRHPGEAEASGAARGRTHLVAGVQGLAPYQFDIDAAAFLSQKGELSARIEAELDQRISQRLRLRGEVSRDLARAGWARKKRLRADLPLPVRSVRLLNAKAQHITPQEGPERGS